MMMPTKCKECPHVGDYTGGYYSRSPHYCCELIWALLEEDYRVKPDSIDKRCPLKDERIASYIEEHSCEVH